MSFHQEIAARYRTMSDKQLTDLYEFEIGGLIPAAREILIQEMKRRNIMPSPLATVSQERYFTINNLFAERLFAFYESGWNLYQLKAYMMEQNCNEEEISLYLEKIKQDIKIKMTKAGKGITNGFVLFVIGLSIVVLPLQMYNHSGLLLMAYATMGAGGLKTMHSTFIKRKMKSALLRWEALKNDPEVIAFPVGEE